MNHQTFNKKSYGFLLYCTFQGLHSLFLSAFIPYNIELLSILLQKYNPVATKTDIGGEKMKKEDQTTVEIQYAYCMKFFERLKKKSLHKQKYRRISVCKLTAQQWDDERTTADGRLHNS